MESLGLHHRDDISQKLSDKYKLYDGILKQIERESLEKAGRIQKAMMCINRYIWFCNTWRYSFKKEEIDQMVQDARKKLVLMVGLPEECYNNGTFKPVAASKH